MGFYGIYPLVMTNIAVEITMYLMDKSTISMAMFNCDVKLSKGTFKISKKKRLYTLVSSNMAGWRILGHSMEISS